MTFLGLGRFIYNYHLNEGSIQVVLFGRLPLKSIPLSKISEMREVSLKETLIPDFTTLRLGNRFFGRILELKKEDGFFRKILITPDDPDTLLKAWRNQRK